MADGNNIVVIWPSALGNLVNEFSFNHASTGNQKPLKYFGGDPYPDKQPKKADTLYENTPGEKASPADFPKYISVYKKRGNISEFGKTFVCSVEGVDYSDSPGKTDDPRRYYKFNYPSRDTLMVKGSSITLGNPIKANVGPFTTVTATQPGINPSAPTVVLPGTTNTPTTVGGTINPGTMNIGGGY
tara:strand:- start:155 stop:712 length:558 start_codon:yes stop_codon:yes gene_type:complete